MGRAPSLKGIVQHLRGVEERRLRERFRQVTPQVSRGMLERFARDLASETDRRRRNERLQEWLAATACLWEYSLHNRLLIHAQRKDAQYVAGRKVWEKRGRPVKAGAQPIYLLAPAGNRFVAVPVYDVRDTDGPTEFTLETISLHGRTARLAAVERAAGLLGIRIREAQREPGLHGVAFARDEVAVVKGLSERERLATLLHEYAHALLHFDPSRLTQLPEAIRELEAESAAYLVARALNEPSKAPAYLAQKGLTGENVLEVLKRSVEASQTILRAIAKAERALKRRPGRTEGRD